MAPFSAVSSRRLFCARGYPDASIADVIDEEDDVAPANEEVPVFLGRKGRVYLFHSPEKLVEFVKSGAEHDLSQLDSWAEVARHRARAPHGAHQIA